MIDTGAIATTTKFQKNMNINGITINLRSAATKATIYRFLSFILVKVH
jgi:hypothetical protein